MELKDAKVLFDQVMKEDGYSNKEAQGIWDGMPEVSRRIILASTAEQLKQRFKATNRIMASRREIRDLNHKLGL